MATGERRTRTGSAAQPRKSTPTGRKAAAARRGTPARGTAAAEAPAGETGRRRQARTTSAVPATAARRQPRSAQKAASEASTTPVTESVGNGSGLLRRTSVTVPVVNLRVPMLSPRVPDVSGMAAQTKWAAKTVRATLPPTERLVYYGSLGVLAAVGALEWPVAAAVGAGVWVAGRTGVRRRGQSASA